MPIWVLVLVVTVAPYKHQHDIQIMKEYGSAYGTFEKCEVARKEMTRVAISEFWLCQRSTVQ